MLQPKRPKLKIKLGDHVHRVRHLEQVVTTSYKHTIEPLIELNDDVVLLDDESDDEYSTNMLKKVRQTTPRTKFIAPVELYKSDCTSLNQMQLLL